MTKLSLHSVAKGRVSSTFVSWFALNCSEKWRAKAAAKLLCKLHHLHEILLQDDMFSWFSIFFHLFPIAIVCYESKGSTQKAIQCSLCTTWTMDNLQELPKFDGTTMNDNGFPCVFSSSQAAPPRLFWTYPKDKARHMEVREWGNGDAVILQLCSWEMPELNGYLSGKIR